MFFLRQVVSHMHRHFWLHLLCVFHLRRSELLFTVILPELLREQLHLLKASGAIRLDPGSSSSIISFVIVVTQVAIVFAISFDHGTYSVTRDCAARLNRDCQRGEYRSGTCDCFVFHDTGFSKSN